MDYSFFEKIIMKRTCFFLIICSVILLVSFFAIRYIFLKMRKEKAMFFALLSLCAIAIIGSVVLSSSVVYSAAYDIKNQAYIIYDGAFSVDKYVEGNGNCTLILFDKKSTKLETDAYVLEAGKHTGKVIYGEKTKIVLSIQEIP